MEIAPRRCGPSPGREVKLGSPSRARFTFPDEPRMRKFLISVTKSDGRSLSSTIFKKDNFGSSPEITLSAWYSSPFSSTTPTALPFLTMTFPTAASVRISAPKLFSRTSNSHTDGTCSAALKSPRAKSTINIAHIMV